MSNAMTPTAGGIEELVTQIEQADKKTLKRLRNALGEKTVEGMISMVREDPEARRVATAVLKAAQPGMYEKPRTPEVMSPVDRTKKRSAGLEF